jgi:hypothetical protein
MLDSLYCLTTLLVKVFIQYQNISRGFGPFACKSQITRTLEYSNYLVHQSKTL